MSDSEAETRKINPVPTAILAGLIAGLAAGFISYVFVGLPGFVVGSIVGALIGSRPVLAINKAKQQKQ